MQLQVGIFETKAESIDFPAISSDLATVSCKWAEITHFDNCISEIKEESDKVGSISSNLRICGATTEELLVRMKEAFVVNKILEITVVK